jgi:ribosomal protein S27AE
MIGIAIEASSKCARCGAKIAMNALVPRILCGQCGAAAEYEIGTWSRIFEIVLKEAPALKPGAGSKVSTLGGNQWEVTYGRQEPQFRETGEPVDLEAALGGLDQGRIFDPQTGAPCPVRRVPAEYREMLAGVAALVGEEPDLLKAATDNVQSPELKPAAKPVALQCPQCHGSLSVGGEERTVGCSFCGASVVIPSEIWSELHPIREVRCWYLLYEAAAHPFHWEGELADAVVDDQGNFYLACSQSGFAREKLCLVSLDPGFRLRWRRDDLGYELINPWMRLYYPRLAIAPGGRLLLWSPDKNALLILSCADGTQIDKIGGTDGRQPPSGKFSLKDCRDLAQDPDGTHLTWGWRGTADEEFGTKRSWFGLVRLGASGERVPNWPEAPGFKTKVGNLFGDSVPHFEQIRSHVDECKEGDVTLTVGQDGSAYLLSFQHLARFKRDGTRLYMIELPLRYTFGRPCVDREGCVLVLGHPSESSRLRIARVSGDGRQISILVANVLDGGGMCKEDVLAVSPRDGTIYALGHGGRLRSFTPRGQLLHVSPSSRKEEEEERENLRKAEE